MPCKNTLNKGSIRCIIFKEDDTWYGVGLEFNLVEQGEDPLEVMASLYQAIQGYVETARKYKMRLFALNQKPDEEYEKLWNNLESGKKIASDKQVYQFGYYTGAFSQDLSVV